MKRGFTETVQTVLSTWFGLGFVPKGPGTAGTIGAIPLYLLLRPHGPWAVAAAAVCLTLVGIWAAGGYAKITGLHDPQKVVIDEVAGVHVAWIACPPTWQGLLAGFLLFRLFDMTKPFPANWAERKLQGGTSIVLDDVFAGMWGAAVVVALRLAGVL